MHLSSSYCAMLCEIMQLSSPLQATQSHPQAPSQLPGVAGPQWGAFLDTAARLNTMASAQHTVNPNPSPALQTPQPPLSQSPQHLSPRQLPLAQTQHQLSQASSQQSLVDEERASRAVQIVALQKQVRSMTLA